MAASMSLSTAAAVVASAGSAAAAGAGGSSPGPAHLLAYLTLVSSDSFVLGAQVLAWSLRQVQSQYPLYALITPNLSNDSRRSLAQSGWHLLLVAPLPHGRTGGHVAAWDDVGYTKLRAWQLVQFQRLLYIDADCIVQRNMDHLLRDVPAGVTFAAAPDVFPPDKFNAGVMLLQPNTRVFDCMVRSMSAATSYDGGDTGFLNHFFPHWFSSPNSVSGSGSGIVVDSALLSVPPQPLLESKSPEPASSSPCDLRHYREGVARLSFGYNALRTMQWFTKKNSAYWQAVQPLYVVHYCSSPKPWEDLDARRGGFLEQEYFRAHAAAMAELPGRRVADGDLPLTFMCSPGGALLPSPDLKAHPERLTPFQALQAWLSLHLDQTPFGEFSLESKELASAGVGADAAAALVSKRVPSGAVRPVRPGVFLPIKREQRFLELTRSILQSCLLSAMDASSEARPSGIPKRIHQIWLGGPLPDAYQSWSESWRRHHPPEEGWSYRLWTDEDFLSFPLSDSLTDVTSMYLASHLRAQLPRCTNVAQRADLFRLDILWTHGGLYVDTDFECLSSHAPFHIGGAWAQRVDFYTGFSNTGAVELNNGLIASVAQHALVGNLIQALELQPPASHSRSRSGSSNNNSSGSSSSSSAPAPGVVVVGGGVRSSSSKHTATEIINGSGPGHFTRTCVKYLEEWQAKRLDAAPTRSLTAHGPPSLIPPVVFFPAQVFYPLPNNMRHLSREEDKRVFVAPCSFAMHHWSCSWQGGAEAASAKEERKAAVESANMHALVRSLESLHHDAGSGSSAAAAPSSSAAASSSSASSSSATPPSSKLSAPPASLPSSFDPALLGKIASFLK